MQLSWGLVTVLSLLWIKCAVYPTRGYLLHSAAEDIRHAYELRRPKYGGIFGDSTLAVVPLSCYPVAITKRDSPSFLFVHLYKGFFVSLLEGLLLVPG
jgi:hypothetical protein